MALNAVLRVDFSKSGVVGKHSVNVLRPSVDPNACRCLFGPVDHEENLRDLRQHRQRLEERNRKRWNFDFQSCRPVSGQFAWTFEGHQQISTTPTSDGFCKSSPTQTIDCCDYSTNGSDILLERMSMKNSGLVGKENGENVDTGICLLPNVSTTKLALLEETPVDLLFQDHFNPTLAQHVISAPNVTEQGVYVSSVCKSTRKSRVAAKSRVASKKSSVSKRQLHSNISQYITDYFPVSKRHCLQKRNN